MVIGILGHSQVARIAAANTHVLPVLMADVAGGIDELRWALSRPRQERSGTLQRRAVANEVMLHYGPG